MANGRLAVLVPSRGRPKVFARFLDSFLEHNAGLADVILRVGDTDLQKDAYNRFIGIPGLVHVVGPDEGFNSTWAGTAGYNPAQQDLYERFPNYAAYLSIEDDTVLHDDAFDLSLLQELDKFSGRVGLIELYDRSQTIHCPCVSAEWCEALGYLFSPEVGEHGFYQLLQLAQTEPVQYLSGRGVAQFTHYPHLREYGYTGDERPGALAQPAVTEAFKSQARALVEWKRTSFRQAKDALLRKAGLL